MVGFDVALCDKMYIVASFPDLQWGEQDCTTCGTFSQPELIQNHFFLKIKSGKVVMDYLSLSPGSPRATATEDIASRGLFLKVIMMIASNGVT